MAGSAWDMKCPHNAVDRGQRRSCLHHGRVSRRGGGFHFSVCNIKILAASCTRRHQVESTLSQEYGSKELHIWVLLSVPLPKYRNEEKASVEAYAI
jgi:hypothetical protein